MEGAWTYAAVALQHEWSSRCELRQTREKQTEGGIVPTLVAHLPRTMGPVVNVPWGVGGGTHSRLHPLQAVGAVGWKLLVITAYSLTPCQT